MQRQLGAVQRPPHVALQTGAIGLGDGGIDSCYSGPVVNPYSGLIGAAAIVRGAAKSKLA